MLHILPLGEIQSSCVVAEWFLQTPHGGIMEAEFQCRPFTFNVIFLDCGICAFTHGSEYFFHDCKSGVMMAAGGVALLLTGWSSPGLNLSGTEPNWTRSGSSETRLHCVATVCCAASKTKASVWAQKQTGLPLLSHDEMWGKRHVHKTWQTCRENPRTAATTAAAPRRAPAAKQQDRDRPGRRVSNSALQCTNGQQCPGWAGRCGGRGGRDFHLPINNNTSMF